MATSKIKTGDEITIDTTGSEGIVFKGFLKFRIEEHDINKFPRLKTHVMLNIATPDTAFEKSFLPNDGVGLAREEFIIASDIGIHPMALVNYDKLPKDLQSEIARLEPWQVVARSSVKTEEFTKFIAESFYKNY